MDLEWVSREERPPVCLEHFIFLLLLLQLRKRLHSSAFDLSSSAAAVDYALIFALRYWWS